METTKKGLITLGWKIEWHWTCIHRCRKQIKHLLETGAQGTPKFRRISEKLDKHCAAVMMYQHRYEKQLGVKRLACDFSRI